MSTLGTQQIRQIVAKKLQHEDFHVESFTVAPHQCDTGIMGEHLHLTCRIDDTKQQCNCTHSFFVKKKDINHNFGDFPAQVFAKEKRIFQLFQTINLQCINASIPSCYYIDEEHLVLSDLISDEYALLRHDDYATDAEMRAVLKSLAGIHAGGIIFEEQQRKATGDENYTLKTAFPDAFVDVHLQDTPLLNRFFAAIVKGVTNAMEILEMPKTLSNGKCVADEVQKLWKIYEIASSKTFRNTICHSDLWHANIFVNAAMTAKIIDFQIVRYMPPAADVLLVILTNTSRDYRRDHLHSLLDAYFVQFAACLREFHINPDLIYTKESFLQSVQEVKFYANMCNTFITPLVTVDKHALADIYKSDELDRIIFEDRSILLRKFKDNAYYVSRVREVLLELLDIFEEM